MTEKEQMIILCLLIDPIYRLRQKKGVMACDGLRYA